MTPHPAAEAAHWAVLSRNRIGDTATPERHREAIEAYVKVRAASVDLLALAQRFAGDYGYNVADDLLAVAARIAELEADVARLRQALKIIAGEQQCLDNLMSNQDVARAALQLQPMKPGA